MNDKRIKIKKSYHAMAPKKSFMKRYNFSIIGHKFTFKLQDKEEEAAEESLVLYRVSKR